METLIERIFPAPVMPPLDLPMATRIVPAVKIAIAQAFKLAYYRGVMDGFLAGGMLVLAIVIAVRSSARPRQSRREDRES